MQLKIIRNYIFSKDAKIGSFSLFLGGLVKVLFVYLIPLKLHYC
jgi:hypothetical protein